MTQVIYCGQRSSELVRQGNLAKLKDLQESYLLAAISGNLSWMRDLEIEQEDLLSTTCYADETIAGTEK